MCTGNEIKHHVDSPPFGDVIVPVGLAGSAHVLWWEARRRLNIRGLLLDERHGSYTKNSDFVWGNDPTGAIKMIILMV